MYVLNDQKRNIDYEENVTFKQNEKGLCTVTGYQYIFITVLTLRFDIVSAHCEPMMRSRGSGGTPVSVLHSTMGPQGLRLYLNVQFGLYLFLGIRFHYLLNVLLILSIYLRIKYVKKKMKKKIFEKKIFFEKKKKFEKKVKKKC